MMFKEELNKKTEDINHIVTSHLPDKTEYDAYVVDAMTYAVSAGGKRIRPLLMQEAFRLFSDEGSDRKTLNSFMSAIEFIHSYSLVHDDLPSMDDANMRRGLPAVHKKFGEAFGVLCGDALLNFAYETIANRMYEIDDAEELKAAAMAFEVLSRKSGIYGMVGGQSLDVYSEKNEDMELCVEEIEYIYKNKTAALIEASLMIGAILAKADDEDIKSIEEAGYSIGLAYQIQDDILDKYGNESEIGKDTGADEKNKKMTYLDHYGLDRSKEMVDKLTYKAVDIIKNISNDKDVFLCELFLFLTKRTK